MQKIKLVKPTSKVLSTPTEIVTDVSTQVIPYIATMRTIMRQNSGVAITANQVGLPYRFFIDKGEIYINPTIEVIDDEEIQGQEGCLSFPGGAWLCKRFKGIALTYETTKGKEKTITVMLPEEVKTRADQATVSRLLSFQHEVDHLNGILLPSHGKKIKRTFGEPEEEALSLTDARNLPVVSLAQLQSLMIRDKKRAEQAQKDK